MKVLKISSGILIAACIGLTLPSCGNDSSKHDANSKEAAKEENDDKFDTRESEKKAEFVVNAVAAQMAEIQVLELAGTRTTNKEIKSMSADMVKDHNLMLEELKAFAVERGVTVPTEITADDAKAIQSLREEKQVDFDKKVLKDLEDRHDKSVKNYEKCADSSEDVDLKNLANKQLPMIRSHRAMVKDMLEKYK